MKRKAEKGEEMGSEPSLKERLQVLNLVGKEEEDLDFSEEIEELVKDVRWMAIFRIHTTKPFSHAALFNAMRAAWAAAKEIMFKEVKETLFSIGDLKASGPDGLRAIFYKHFCNMLGEELVQ
ncbi:hypothetical protein PR202_gb22774 [Eleusine coracana subsp. coracana]|uniref:Uncharacterized protein n=1 Tax=Eleusine coracana subsp. coracana TaxID=191504 RepID=A0AAV5FHF8_ELECO|nr:hypothetical protein PR202_gb22774 [Eleusine coracana subsp. coracana]